MKDLQKLKDHFQAFTKSGIVTPDNNEFRKEAFERFCKKGFPNIKQEHWKYSPLSKDLLKIDEFKFEKTTDTSINQSAFEQFDHYKIILKDGILISEDCNEQGLKIIQNKPRIFCEIVKNPILDFNNAFFTSGFEVLVEQNQEISKPVVIYNIFSKSFNGNNINIKNNITVEANAKLEVYEKNIFEKDEFIFFTKNLEIDLKDGAKLNKYYLNSTTKNKTIYNLVKANLAKDSQFEKFNFSHNVSSCRDEIIIDLNGKNSFASLNNIQHLSDKCYHEIKWEVNHNEENTRSSQFVKSALHEEAVAAFQGKIYVDSKAQKTDGYQLSRALLLSDQSKFLSKPELEIYADDVKCSHGSSSGSIDSDSIFYLRSRGISEQDAKRMMIQGFLNEVIDKVQNETIKEIFLNKLNEINQY